MDFLLQLHTDMFLGQPGMWLLGAMGLLFVLALVSGTVLYAPFMRRLSFGTVRKARSERVRRLDQHNLFGVVALAWMAVIGLTGAINAFADPLIEGWRDGEVAAMTAAYADDAPLPPARYGSLDAAMASAQAALPGQEPAIHRLSRRRLVLGPSLRDLLSGRPPGDPAPADPGAGRCRQWRADRCAQHARAQPGADDLQAAAFRRLRRAAAQAGVDAADAGDDLGAVDRAAAVVPARPGRSIERRIEEIRTGARSRVPA
jgi:uncharacterized iron-regulated membrane protein